VSYCEFQISEIIEMALSDKVPFKAIKRIYALNETEVKHIMKANLKRSSYLAWRKRVSKFRSRRQFYKE